MEKYYKPDITEFCVGFRYEVLQKGNLEHNGLLTFMPNNTKDEWYTYKFPDPFVGYKLDSLFKQELRVKYLDKSDIEECGFKEYWDKDYRDRFISNDEKVIIDFDKKDHLLNIYIGKAQFIVIKVLNITEFRKVIKMLSI